MELHYNDLLFCIYGFRPCRYTGHLAWVLLICSSHYEHVIIVLRIVCVCVHIHTYTCTHIYESIKNCKKMLTKDKGIVENVNWYSHIYMCVYIHMYIYL